MAVILVVGSTGAGKTTYAKKLSLSRLALVYSIDEWMVNLFWPEMPSNADSKWFQENHEWYLDRIERCERLILKMVKDQVRANQNVILDLGFSTARHRTLFIHSLASLKTEIETHFLDVPKEVRWERVQRRNQEKSTTYTMHVDREMFDFVESLFEPPDKSEGSKLIVIKASR